MSPSELDPTLIGDVNPFSSMAVARISDLQSERVTIVTPAVREAIGLLDDFLTRSADSSRPGSDVLAIVGDYGTGKTHLVFELLRRADLSSGGRSRSVYLEARATPFVDLYQRFVTQLGLDVFRDRVREYYADVIADELGDTGITASIAEKLRQGGVEPETAVERLGLPQGQYLEGLQRKIEEVTNNVSFSTALTLLMRRGFEIAVWEWLSGHEPDQILVDRGITLAIASEEFALEAIGVVALLCGHRRRQFIVVVDEMDKLVSMTDRLTPNTLEAFGRLLEVFQNAGAMLVLSGLPDYLDVVGDRVKRRIGHVISVSALTTDDTVELIRLSQNGVGRGMRLLPFDKNTADYLVKLTDGNARRIVRMCGQLYRMALDQAATPAEARVTSAMVRQVARPQSGFTTTDNVRNEIRRVLTELGLDYLRDRIVNQTTGSRADYWISVDDDGSGCALVIAESVLDEGESTPLIDRAVHIHAAVERVETVLIVVGLVHADVRNELTGAFGVEPIVYDKWTFTDTLAAVLAARLQALDSTGSRDPLVSVRERVGRVSRQQANTQRLVERLTSTLDDMRSTTDRQLTLIQRELGDLMKSTRSDTPAHGAPHSTQSRLPSSVAQLFATADQSLRSLDQVEVALRTTFASAGQERNRASDWRLSFRPVSRSQNVLQALGVAALLRKLVDAFRNGVNEWYRTSLTDTQRRKLHSDDRAQLSALCQAYDAVYEDIPVHRLRGLSDLSRHPAEGGATISGRPQELTDLRETFDELSNRVRTAVLESVEGGNQP